VKNKEELKNNAMDWLALLAFIGLALCLFVVTIESPVVALNVAVNGLIVLALRWSVVRIYRRWFTDEDEAIAAARRVSGIAVALIVFAVVAVGYAQNYTQNPYTRTPTTATYNPSNTGFDNQLTGNYYYNGYHTSAREWFVNHIDIWGPLMHGFGNMFNRNEDPLAPMMTGADPSGQ
jgi:hypothetical protein